MKESRKQRWLITIGVLLGLILLTIVRWFAWPVPAVAPSPTQTVPNSPTVPTVSAIDLRELRQRAWTRIEARLDEADLASQQAMKESLDRVVSFFRSKHGGARPFAEDVLSLRGKWAFVKEYLPFTQPGSHAQFLQERFVHRVLNPQDLQACLEGCVTGYVSRLQGIENQLLVKVRADLSEGELMTVALPVIKDRGLFAQEFERRMKEAAQIVNRDTQVRVGQECLSLVGGELAAVLVLRVGVAVTQRLGTSAGLLGAAVSSSWATLGLGVIAMFAVDYLLSAALSAAGYDPESAIAERIVAGLVNLEQMFVHGVPEARQAYEKLRDMARTDPDPGVRQACQVNADRIARGGQLGLRFEFEQLHRQRSQLRREALRRVVVGEEP